MNYSTAYEYDDGDSSWEDIPALEFWNGGILFVLVFDAIIALFGFLLFIFVRHASLTQGDTLVNVTKKNSKLRLWYSKLLHRHSERKIQEVNGWFGWIPATIKADSEQVLEECGRDGFLYLRFQRLLIIVLSLESAVAMPILLSVNLTGDASLEGFGITTSNHVMAGSNMFWVVCASVFITSLLIIWAVYKTLSAVQHNTTKEEIASARLFTAKIENFPRSIKNEEILYNFFEELYPGSVLQIYICLNMNDLQRKYHELTDIEQQIMHYEVEYSTLGYIPHTYSNKIARWICCPAVLRPRMDALQLFYGKKSTLERKIKYLSNRDYPSTGVCFVTFKKAEFRKQFIKDFRKTNLPCTSLSEKLKVHKWLVTGAPNSEDIRWKSLRVGIVEYFLRFIGVNLVLFFFLFFFTTPVAMIGGLKEYTTEAFNFDFNFKIVSFLESKTWGTLLLGYLPSLVLLGLTFIMPHILYFTTKLEGYHTRYAQNRAGLLKVFFYQLVAILILPSLALTSLKALLSLSIDDLEGLWEESGLFPNGSFFVEYILQAAFLGNICDLWRGPELLLEKVNKSRAITRLDLEAAETVPPFKFGYEYQYFLLQFTITLFYSSVVPIIIPCGLFYLVLKHNVDKYNLLYYYPKAPDSKNQLTTTVIWFTLVALGLYQFSMAIYFYFYKAAQYEALTVLACALISLSTGIYLNLKLRRFSSRLFNHPDMENIDPEDFRDAYLHPCYRKKREYEQAKSNEVPLVVDYDYEDDSNIDETQSLLLN